MVAINQIARNGDRLNSSPNLEASDICTISDLPEAAANTIIVLEHEPGDVPQAAAMGLKEYVISENKAVVRYDPVVLALSRKLIDRTQYKLYAAQRAYVATNFIRLVDKGAQLARAVGDVELAEAFQSNLNDELGVGADGQRHQELDHRVWKTNYLRALGLKADVQGFPLLRETRAHVDAFLDIEAKGTLLNIAGTILSLENIIPLEYRAAVASRDHLFPEIFCFEPDDDVLTWQHKETARQYLNDHIVHDSKSHFPQLLQALLKYEGDTKAMEELRAGIDMVNTYRKRFYKGLGMAMQLNQRDMEYYTYGS
jgi:pyrroloquinoline quinone (PQQ) biosynthesis protein C